MKLLVRLKLKDGLAGFEELDPNLIPALRSYPISLEKSFQKTEAELIDIHNFLKEKHIRFVVALIPALQTVDGKAFRHSISYSIFDVEDFDLEKPYERLEEFCKACGIEVINTLPAFKERHNENDRLYLFREMHFSYSGHKLFAQEIYNYLTQGKLAVR